MRPAPVSLAAVLSSSIAAGASATPYRQPPDPIPRILDAKQPPVVSLSPDRGWMLLLERPELPPISELAAPWIALGGFRIDPATNGPARDYTYRGMELKRLEPGKGREIVLPAGARIGDPAWSRDGRRAAFTVTVEDGIALWILDTRSAEARALTSPTLNAAYGEPCEWLHGDEELLCRFIDEGRGPAPAASRVPEGPIVEESKGRKAAARTFTNLLKDAKDEALFEHYLTSSLERVALDGTRTRVVGPALIARTDPSPDGRFVLVSTVHRPYSHSLPVFRFPVRTEILDRAGRSVHLVADLPLADEIPITFDSVRQGPRDVSWRSDAPATLSWVEALDGGDARAKVERRDALKELAAPFTAEPRELWRSELRMQGASWGREDLALVTESWWDTRRTRTWAIDPSRPDVAPRLIWDRDSQDQYRNPGSPLRELGEHGWVLRFAPDGKSIYTQGRGASPEGLHPFLDRVDLASVETERLWQSEDPRLESVVDVLDDSARRFVTRRESRDEPPQYVLRRRGSDKLTTLTTFEDPAPELAGLTKQLITYERADGVPLSATLYLPPGYDARRDGPLPTFFWAYPTEFKSRESAGQVTSSPHQFRRPTGDSILFLLTQGWAIVEDPTIPILGEGDDEPNDTYVAQLVAGAQAAIDHVVSLGVTDRDRCAIGGHSYGAFTAANLLAHSDLFRAAVARSGAYNRTLTPFGFQGEQRDFWEAADTYVAMSPFTVAGKIDEPLLIIHGAEDSNSGTYPIQSERLYEAVKGLGGTVRFVKLPYEDHGYRARESVGHVLWETIEWLDAHVKRAPPRRPEEPTPSGRVSQR